ncbi:uncharacterized protein LOC115970130 [Quercus lobata]|uniref:uncharacterized protein LOC115970130 n=1 Tax=Quercus lobata TaxID=97700 RepID=UPI0012454E57|nr:uncharacterized protein LOC115970130 [Quercus lobata]
MGLHLLLVLSLCLCYKAVGEGITNVKPIQQRYDREFDCVDIYKQPAFDHPLLKNHKIQAPLDPSYFGKMAPSFSGNVLNNYDTKIGKFSKIGLQDEGCPPGMFATYHTKSNNRINHGARAIISLENPSVEMGQYSMAQIWVQKGQFNGLESIQAGWAVDPVLYGDSRTRITTYWTVDNFGKTGCFNSECPGFVQVHPRLHPGSPFANISVFQGQQFVTDILIAQWVKGELDDGAQFAVAMLDDGGLIVHGGLGCV